MYDSIQAQDPQSCGCQPSSPTVPLNPTSTPTTGM